VFDRDGVAYALAGTSAGRLLLHSKDRCRSWVPYSVPINAKLEHDDGNNDLTGPPPLVTNVGDGGAPLSLCVPTKNANGSLVVPDPLRISSSTCFLTPRHSGDGNVVVTKNARTHVVWMTMETMAGHSGEAPCYAATFDRSTGRLSAPSLIGFASTTDNHNGPVITIDSRSILHVVIGAHHKRFRYTRSLKPNSTTGGWTEPETFGVDAVGGGYTYTALVCDRDDTLHLVSRYAGDGYYFRLNYQRRKADQPWENNKYLVNPFRAFYSIWYHKLTIDRKGRLFLNYSYYANQLDRDRGESGELAAYRKKWADEKITGPGPSTWWKGIRAHDPCIIMSDDGGDNWRLATTRDFLSGIQ